MDYARSWVQEETWYILENETPVELSLMSCLSWDEVREVGLGEQLEEAFEGFNQGNTIMKFAL